ncbi:hypothetical protein GCM10027294_23760 [Marinactinospora endophytica]
MPPDGYEQGFTPMLLAPLPGGFPVLAAASGPWQGTVRGGARLVGPHATLPARAHRAAGGEGDRR